MLLLCLLGLLLLFALAVVSLGHVTYLPSKERSGGATIADPETFDAKLCL